MTVKLGNNLYSTLAGTISLTDTSATLASGTGSLFPTLAAGEYFYATLISTGGIVEIVKVTARVGDGLTIVRAQDGTSAASFAAGSRVELRITAQSVLDAASDAVDAVLPLTASDVSISDAGGYYTGATVEAALQEAALAATVRVADVGSYYAGSNVESVLQEAAVATAGKLSLDGTSSMTGPVKAAPGSSAAPSITFSNDTDTGFYRKDANVIGIAAGGVEVATISSAGVSTVPTGVMMPYVATTAPSGWVRANGRTIGSAASGATERANADTATLYALLWGSYGDTVCPVAGGRGASGAADFAANKPLTLPDLRGRAFFGLDGMGNSAASRLGTVITSPTTNGFSGGTETHTLVTAELPSHTHAAGTLANSTTGAHTHTYGASNPLNATSGASASISAASATAGTTSSAGDHTHTISGSTASAGSNTAHSNMPPAWLTTYIIKL